MRVIYFRAELETTIGRLQPPRAAPKLEKLLDQCICVAEDDGAGLPVWSAVIPDSLEAKARAHPAKFLGVGMEEVWTNFKDVAKLILRKRVETDTGEVVEMAMADATPAGATIIENAIPPHTFAGYDIQTGLPEQEV